MTALLLILAACSTGGGDVAAPAARPPRAVPTVHMGEAVKRTTQAGFYQVEVRFVPAEPKLGELFVAEAVLRDKDGVLIDDGKVALDARMPQHNHGMETDPIDLPGACDAAKVCTHAGGVYRTEGFKFHMPGAWTVTVDAVGPRGADSTSFVVEMK